MADNFFFHGPAPFKRDRSLTESTLISSQIRVDETNERPPITDESLRELFDGFAFQINRATALIKEIEKQRRNNFVPVDVDATRARAAVRRQDQGADGSQISFDLYKAMIDAQIKASRNVSYEIVGELSGELLTDSKKIERYMKNGGKGLSTWEEFLLYADQWLILFLLDRLTTQFQCQQHKECTVGKTPVGTEDPAILQRNAISVAAMLLILGMREQDVLVALDRAGNALNIPPVDLLNRARRLERTDLEEALTSMVGADDPATIIAYTENYISRHPEGYDDWLAYGDLKRLREDAAVTYVHAHEYSREHAVLLEYSSKSVDRQPDIGFFGQLAGLKVVRPMTGNHLEALTSKLAGIDLGISSIAGSLTFSFAMDFLCCIARFFGKQDIKLLKKIRSLLRVAYAGVTGSINTSMLQPTDILATATQAILQRMINFIEEMFDKVVGDITKWVDGKSDEVWGNLFECPLIADLIGYITDAISRLRSVMFNVISKYAGNISSTYQGMFRRWGSVADARRLSTILNILDAIINTIEACAPMGPGEDGPTNIPDPGDDPALGGLGPKRLDIPPDLVEQFFAHTDFISRGDALHPIPPVNKVLTTAEDVTNVRNFRELCLGIMPDSLLQQLDSSSEAS